MKFTSFLLTATLFLSVPQLSFGMDSKPNTEHSVYRMAIPEKIMDFDPLKADNSTDASIIRNIYSTLVSYRTKKDNLNQSYSDIVPDLAEDWNISSDRRVYNFRLKNNVLFHNGRKFTAFDVKHTMERIANPRNLSNSMDWLFKDLPIEGLAKFQAQCYRNVTNPDLAGVKVIDDYIIQIKLTQPLLFITTARLPSLIIVTLILLPSVCVARTLMNWLHNSRSFIRRTACRTLLQWILHCVMKRSIRWSKIF